MLDRLEPARAGARSAQVEEGVAVSAHRVGDPGAGGKAAPHDPSVAQQRPKLTLAPEGVLCPCCQEPCCRRDSEVVGGKEVLHATGR